MDTEDYIDELMNSLYAVDGCSVCVQQGACNCVTGAAERLATPLYSNSCVESQQIGYDIAHEWIDRYHPDKDVLEKIGNILDHGIEVALDS